MAGREKIVSGKESFWTLHHLSRFSSRSFQTNHGSSSKRGEFNTEAEALAAGRTQSTSGKLKRGTRCQVTVHTISRSATPTFSLVENRIRSSSFVGSAGLTFYESRP